MTLSNFDWTDKDSVKWFILLPTGHEGPYSLNSLIEMKEKKKIAGDVKVWAEGLSDSITLKKVLEMKSNPVVHEEVEEYIPDLPPLPEEEIPPVPMSMPEETIEIIEHVKPKSNFAIPPWGFIPVVVLIMFFFAFGSIVKNHENFDIRRMPKMSMKLHERILKENQFDGWNKKLFFKEYLSDDHGHIWFVTSSFHTCQVEATFTSLKDKMLALGEEKVAFKTKGHLDDHIVEFSSFDFTSGNKIVPGMYEVDIRATNCEWDGFIPVVMNKLSSPDTEYVARQKVILFSKGPVEFNKILDRLVKKKSELALKEQNQNELFWQDLQQKLETLQAITLQIEQHLLDFLDEKPEAFTKNLKPMIDKYTRQFGSFLTSFVVENENYFKSLNPEAKGVSQKRNYELMVRITTKKIGLETMKFIEEFQSLKKKPTQADINKYTDRVKKVFAAVKSDIAQKIIQVSEDRSK